MDRQSQIDYLLELYQSPEHKHEMANPDVSFQGGNPGCGDIVTYHIKVDENGNITDLSFEGEGCTISQAAAELVAERHQHATLEEIEELDNNDIIDALGREIVMSRPRCASLALTTLKTAVQQYRHNQRVKAL